jgi:hypothetical protein
MYKPRPLISSDSLSYLSTFRIYLVSARPYHMSEDFIIFGCGSSESHLMKPWTVGLCLAANMSAIPGLNSKAFGQQKNRGAVAVESGWFVMVR